MKIDNYHHRQLVWLISQIKAQRNMVGFVVDGHIYTPSIVSVLSDVLCELFLSWRSYHLILRRLELVYVIKRRYEPNDHMHF